MIDKSLVEKLVLERLGEMEGYFVVDIRISSNNVIQVEIDNINGRVAIDDCVRVSRNVEHNLDREEEDFELTVSSAGLDKPLRVLKQFYKAVGKQVTVYPGDGQKKIEGEMLSADEEGFVLQTKTKEKVEGRKKKEWVVKEHPFKYDEVKQVKRIISFK